MFPIKLYSIQVTTYFHLYDFDNCVVFNIIMIDIIF